MRKRKHLSTIGGSTAPAALGLSPYMTQNQLASVLRGDVEPEDLSGNPDVKRGSELEKPMLRLAAKELGIQIRPHRFTQPIRSAKYPWAHSTPDGWHGEAIVSLKLPRPHGFAEAMLKGLKKEWVIQEQHNMAVAESPVCINIVACVVTMRYLRVDTPVDHDFQSALMDAERQYHTRAMAGERFEEPRPVALDVPEYEGTLKILDSEAARKAAREYLEAKALLEESESIVDLAKEQLQEAMGEPGVYEIPIEGGALRAYWKTRLGKLMFDHNRAVAENPSLSAYYKTGDSYRELRTYRVKG